MIHPSQKNILLGIPRFTEFQTYGTGQPIHTGLFGEIYGVRVLVTTQVPTVAADDTTTLYRTNLLLHKDTFILAKQMDVRVQSDYLVEKLAHAVVTDAIYGVKIFRATHAVSLFTPNA